MASLYILQPGKAAMRATAAISIKQTGGRIENNKASHRAAFSIQAGNHWKEYCNNSSQ
jgi:hypothetical protein